MWMYLLTFIVLLLLLIVRRKFSYWDRQVVPFIEPRFPLGNIDLGADRIHLALQLTRFYKEMKNKFAFCGLYFFTSPVALIMDLDLIQNILVRDYTCFHDRGLYCNEKDDPISAHLFRLEGEKWSKLRKKLLPIFSPAKIKIMLPTIVAVVDRFKECLEKAIAQDSEVEMKDLLSRLTTDLIGSCAFGIECNSLIDPDAEFRLFGKKALEMPLTRLLVLFFGGIFHGIARKLHLKQVPSDVSEFFFGVVRKTIEYRDHNNVERKDFLNLLMQLREKDPAGDDAKESADTLSFNSIVAQSYAFFLGGFETSSTVMSYCLYELSLNEEIQEKARECVKAAVEKHGGFTYDAVMDMAYIEQCLNESLRKYPPGSIIHRIVTKDYCVPYSGVILERGMRVVIPLYAIHHDPEYYPDPERFDPERFTPEECAQREAGSFMPFGVGPRTCIAARFGMLQAQIGLAKLVQNFRFSPCSKSVIPIRISPKHLIITPADGLWLKVEKLESEQLV